jgi:hypothetical protein
MISGDLDPRLRDGRLVGDVTIVTVAARREPSNLMTIGLMGGSARSVRPFCREQRSSRRRKNGDEKSDGRQVGSQAGHDAVLACIGSAKPNSLRFGLLLRRARRFPVNFSTPAVEVPPPTANPA